MIRVLVVDDSAFARLSISKQLDADPGIEIAGFARDGIEALEKVKELKPGVITLDVSMPRMDGLEALKRIMSEEPTPVVMLSGLTDDGTEATIRALELGAVDFFLKAPKATSAGFFGLDGGLNAKIKVASRIGKARLRAACRRRIQPRPEKMPAARIPVRPFAPPTKVVVIGSSTGGPAALYEVIPNLPADIPAAILVVQHMPPLFTKSLSDRLNELSQITVKEAEAGDPLLIGQALVAPGGYHMVVNNGKIALNQKEPVLGLRPAANVTMQSIAQAYGAASIGIVLTGMGSDGTDGAAAIKAAGGRTAAQDQKTSAIYGMPRSVVESGNADKIVPLTQMAREIIRMCQ